MALMGSERYWRGIMIAQGQEERKGRGRAGLCGYGIQRDARTRCAYQGGPREEMRKNAREPRTRRNSWEPAGEFGRVV